MTTLPPVLTEEQQQAQNRQRLDALFQRQNNALQEYQEKISNACKDILPSSQVPTHANEETKRKLKCCVVL
jgi:hypothetical protein